MPYTPPAQRSPASSFYFSADSAAQDDSTPTHHYQSPPRSPGLSRPNLPRSSSSCSRSRNSADLTASASDQPRPSSPLKFAGDAEKHSKSHLSINTSVCQSPSPKTDNAMPAGAIMSPPASDPASSDEEDSKAPTRHIENLEELTEAVRSSLHVNKGSGSPPDNESDAQQVQADASPPLVTMSGPPKLSHAARKISHSRSSTEPNITYSPAVDTPANTSVSDGSEDEEVHMKPPLLRKKSGELVKPAIRPGIRRKGSSMPGTPTYHKKGVHFNDDLEHVRHFLQVDRPIAVSAGGSPVEVFEDETEFPFGRAHPFSSGFDLKLGNFPRESLERQSQPVRLDRVTLSADQKSLVGGVVVANLAFHKLVVARFTFDNWRTTSEVVAEYNNDTRVKPKDGFDRFDFNIKLTDQTNLDKKTMLICMRYNVNATDYWDNNDFKNFQVEFVKREQKAQSAPRSVASARGPPRSRNSVSSSNRPRSVPSLDDDFSNAFDEGSTNFRFRQPAKPMLPDTPPPKKPSTNGQQFGSRYDFGASLTAALTHAQAQLGDRSGIQRKQPTFADKKEDSSNGAVSKPGASTLSLRGRVAPGGSGTDSPRADNLLATKQSLDSRAYQEFVAKFCFAGSGKPAASSNPQQPSRPSQPSKEASQPPNSDGANDEDVSTEQGRAKDNTTTPKSSSKAGNDYTSYVIPQPFFGAHDSSPGSSQTSYDYGSGSASPGAMNFQFGQHNAGGFLSSGSPTPPAIRG